MDETPPENKARETTPPPARRSMAPWIVAGTIASWIIFSVAMTYFVKHFPDQDRSPFDLWLWVFASIPGVPGLMLLNPPSEVEFWSYVAILGVAFAGLETLAWKKRITWLAWVLLAWLLADMVLMVVIFQNQMHNAGS